MGIAKTFNRSGVAPLMFPPLHQAELQDLRAFWHKSCGHSDVEDARDDCSSSSKSSSWHTSDANSE